LRPLVIALAILVLVPSFASAAGALPQIRKGTGYKATRAQMIAAGFRPQPILRRPSDEPNPCGGPLDLCREAPEVLACAVNGICAYLYARDSDGAFAVVIAWSESGGYFTGVRWTDQSDLEDIRRVVIARPAPRDRRRGP